MLPARDPAQLRRWIAAVGPAEDSLATTVFGTGRHPLWQPSFRSPFRLSKLPYIRASDPVRNNLAELGSIG